MDSNRLYYRGYPLVLLRLAVAKGLERFSSKVHQCLGEPCLNIGGHTYWNNIPVLVLQAEYQLFQIC